MKFRFRFVIFPTLLVAFSQAAIAQGVPCPDLRITRTLFASSDADLAAGIRAEAGPGARSAEWAEVKACLREIWLVLFSPPGSGEVTQAPAASPGAAAPPAASIPTPVAPSAAFRRRAALVIGNSNYRF